MKKLPTLPELFVFVVTLSLVVAIVLWLEARPHSNKRAIARTQCAQLVYAVVEYYKHFNRLPPKAVEDNSALLQALGGRNPEKIIFFDCSPEDPRDGLKDPWGTPYHVAFSADTPFTVTVWSSGENKRNENGEGDDIVKQEKLPEQPE